jgi:hypothetical protein
LGAPKFPEVRDGARPVCGFDFGVRLRSRCSYDEPAKTRPRQQRSAFLFHRNPTLRIEGQRGLAHIRRQQALDKTTVRFIERPACRDANAAACDDPF